MLLQTPQWVFGFNSSLVNSAHSLVDGRRNVRYALSTVPRLVSMFLGRSTPSARLQQEAMLEHERERLERETERLE